MSDPVVFLTMPRAGKSARVFDATRAFWLPAARTRAVCVPFQSSSLPSTFNDAWCAALNDQHGYGFTHFAMIHDDVVPRGPWLDILMDEMAATGADVVAAVIPIKDRLGLTTTAIDTPGHEWFVRRLSLTEIFQRPETFTEPHLLINTGLWLCKLGPWCRKTWFQQLHRIAETSQGLLPVQMSEDWDWSRMAARLGAKLYATRKVKLYHEDHEYHNHFAWGEQKTDESYCAYIKQYNSDSLADIPGWLTDEEGHALAKYAAGKEVLEIGSYCGRSTVFMARVAAKVIACDTFDGRGTVTEHTDTLGAFSANLERYGVRHKVDVRQCLSRDLEKVSVDVAFIDGSHDLESVREDIAVCRRSLRPGGLLLFHDYRRAVDPDVTVAVDEVIGCGGRLIETVGTVAVVRPAA